MQNIDMHAADVHMHLNDSHGHTQMTPVAQEQTQTEDRSRVHNYYPVLPDAPSQSGFYMSEAFTNSPTNSSTTSDASPHSDFQTMAPATGLGSSSSSSTISRSFRSSSLSMGMSGNRSMPLIPSSPLSPPHLHHSSISSHPHMHPSPYYSVQHNTGSPGFPTTPVASHHAQGSSSSSHSSGHTRYSFRGSPVPRTFPRGHSRSNSYGTLSTISVRSSSPASSVTSGFTSLSGGPGSAPASTGGALGSPISYDCGDVHMPYGGSSPTTMNSPPGDHSRSQSHPPLSMPTPRSSLGYPNIMHPSRKSFPDPTQNPFTGFGSNQLLDMPTESSQWLRPSEFVSPNSSQRLTDEAFQTHYAPRPIGSRAPHRKQKLANSDRKAICLYARNHPSARQEDIAARYNVERSTISKILKNKERWLGCQDDDTKIPRKRLLTSSSYRKPRFDDLELVLTQWVEETRNQKLVLSDALIRSKAKEEARRIGIAEDKFKASSGWLENFKHRVGIRKGKYIGRDTASNQDSNALDRTDSGIPRVGSGLRTAVWPSEDKGVWQAEHVPKQEEEAMMLHSADPTFHEAHIAGIDNLSAGSSQIDSKPVGMRRTRSRTLADGRQSQQCRLYDDSPFAY
ncbi:hypothetical protein M422DRAFT_42551 [Sphaerobolus stellatus SS14]|nr:hypothetical protein M422DRAFT_42551 [Sphaerobolus stellatus SS14]